jgi:hypothetical protein
MKHLKFTLATCIISRCGFLRRLHRGSAIVAGGDARWAASASGPGASPTGRAGAKQVQRQEQQCRRTEKWQELRQVASVDEVGRSNGDDTKGR